jgi:two-component system cell cycle response regulator DivK
LDIDMPGKSGTMFYATLRKDVEVRGIPVIVISGVGPRPPSLTKDIPTVTKPISPEYLLSLVEERLSTQSQGGLKVP